MHAYPDERLGLAEGDIFPHELFKLGGLCTTKIK